jgi:hypothetical protein
MNNARAASAPPSSSNSASSSSSTTTTAPPSTTTTTSPPTTTTTTTTAPPSSSASSSASSSSSASTNADNAEKQKLIEGLVTLGASKSSKKDAEDSKKIIRDALNDLSLKDLQDIDAQKNNPLLANMITPQLISQLIALRKTPFQ